MKTKFTLDLNLDDLDERNQFIRDYGCLSGRSIARRLGLSGPGSATLAQALKNYAWNAAAAYRCRMSGLILVSGIYEKISDRIYKNDIAPVCDCW